MLTLDEVKGLASSRVSPAISIFLPTHPESREIRQDPTRLKNLAQEATQRLTNHGYRSAVARELVQPAVSLVADAEFWRQGGEGVALFLGPDFYRCYRVPVGLREELAVGEHFLIKPLLGLLGDDGAFCIIAVSAANARVFTATRFQLAEVTGVPLPAGVRAVASETEYQDTVLGHPVSRQPVWPTRHGMGKVSNAGEAPEELRHTELMEYLKRVASVLNDWFSGKRMPVVLAALPDVRGHMRAMIGRLSPGELDINPDTCSADELRQRAYDVVRPSFAAGREQVLDQLRMLYANASPKAGIHVLEIVEGALYGRVGTLFLADGASLWGRVDEKTMRVEADPALERAGEDLLNRAAIETLVHGGHVFVLPQERLPVPRPAAAIFRY